MLGAIEVQMSDEDDIATQRDWFDLLAHHLSMILQLQDIPQTTTTDASLSERREQVFNQLDVGQDFATMATLIAEGMFRQPGRFLTISTLVYDDTDTIQEWQLSAHASHAHTLKTPEALPSLSLVWHELAEATRERLLAGKSMKVDDIEQHDGLLDDALAKWLLENDLRSTQSFPIMQDEKLTAILSIFGHETNAFSRDEQAAFRQLADQISALVTVRQALDDVEQTLETSRQQEALAAQLVDANRQVSLSTSYDEIALAALNATPDTIHYVAVQIFDRAISQGETPHYVETKAAAIDGKGMLLDLRDDLESGFRHPIFDTLLGGEAVFIPDLSDFEAQVSPSPIEYARQQNVKSGLAMGLRVGNRLWGQLIFGSRDAMDEALQTNRNFRILADQIGITVENRNLLQQTETSLEEARLLYYLNRDLLSTKSQEDILRVVYRYFGDDPTTNRFTLVEMNYNEAGDIETITTRFVIGNDGDVEEVNTPLHETLPTEEIPALKAYWQKLGSDIEYIENMETATFRPLHKQIFEWGIGSAVTIPIARVGHAFPTAYPDMV